MVYYKRWKFMVKENFIHIQKSCNFIDDSIFANLLTVYVPRSECGKNQISVQICIEPILGEENFFHLGMEKMELLEFSRIRNNS